MDIHRTLSTKYLQGDNLSDLRMSPTCLLKKSFKCLSCENKIDKAEEHEINEKMNINKLRRAIYLSPW